MAAGIRARHPPTAAGRLVANLNIDMPILTAPTRDIVAMNRRAEDAHTSHAVAQGNLSNLRAMKMEGL